MNSSQRSDRRDRRLVNPSEDTHLLIDGQPEAGGSGRLGRTLSHSRGDINSQPHDNGLPSGSRDELRVAALGLVAIAQRQSTQAAQAVGCGIACAALAALCEAGYVLLLILQRPSLHLQPHWLPDLLAAIAGTAALLAALAALALLRRQHVSYDDGGGWLLAGHAAALVLCAAVLAWRPPLLVRLVAAGVAGLALAATLVYALLWLYRRRLLQTLCPDHAAPPNTWATLTYTEYARPWPPLQPRHCHVPLKRPLVSVGSDPAGWPGSCHFSLASMPFSNAYPLTQIEHNVEVDAGPSIRRRRLGVAPKQFSLFFDAATCDVYLQPHDAALPLFVGFENTARFHGLQYVDTALAGKSDAELEYRGPVADTVLRALPRGNDCYCIYRHADFLALLDDAVAQGQNVYAQADFMSRLVIAFSDPRGIDPRRAARGECAVRVTLLEARRALEARSCQVLTSRERSDSQYSRRSERVPRNGPPPDVTVKLSPSPKFKRAQDRVTAQEYNQLQKRVNTLRQQLTEAAEARTNAESALAVLQERYQLLRTRSKTLVEEHEALREAQKAADDHVEVLQNRCEALQSRAEALRAQLAEVLSFLEQRAEADPAANTLLVALLESQGFSLTSRTGSVGDLASGLNSPQ